MMKKRWLRITGMVLLVLIALLVAGSYLVEEPLRKYVEREVNARLKGYSVRIGTVSVHPLSISVDVGNLFVIQKENPTPPIADITRIRGGLRWRDLFTGHIVADAVIDRPKFYLNLKNLKTEVKKPPARKEAWQDVLESLTPITVNEFRIRNGEVTYLESPEAKPLVVSGFSFTAHNVKNVKARPGAYPSDIAMEASVAGSTITMQGQADFMLKPHAAVKADIDLHDLDLSHFAKIAERHHVLIKSGVVTARAHVQFSPDRKIFILNDLTLKNGAIDYLYSAAPLPREVKEAKKAEAAAKAKELQKELVNKPGLLIMAKRIRITSSNFGMVNETAKPSYRVFMSETDLELANFSNHFSEGAATLFLKGQFMGSGDTVASGTFRPEKKGPDFDIRIAIKNTRMPAMNDIFRAYGNFDVSAGAFSFYSELAVKNNKVTGYVKPLFRQMKVYDKRTDKEKGEFHKLYEEIVGGVAKLLQNRPRKAVATETPVIGTLGGPKTSTWDALVNIIRNAFFTAILPGFEKNITGKNK